MCVWDAGRCWKEAPSKPGLGWGHWGIAASALSRKAAELFSPTTAVLRAEPLFSLQVPTLRVGQHR